MKKMILIALALFSVTSHAELSADCRKDIQQVAEQRKLVLAGIASGEITAETRDFLLNSTADMATTVIANHALMTKMTIEKKQLQRDGRISTHVSERAAQQVATEGLALYQELIK